jgi:hypothetical protein
MNQSEAARSESTDAQIHSMIENGGPNLAHVLTLIDQIGQLDLGSLRILGEAFDRADMGRWDAAAGAGWRSACAAGITRQCGWYRARHAAAAIATERGASYEVAYFIGYVAGAVANRDLLAPEHFNALTAAWKAIPPAG